MNKHSVAHIRKRHLLPLEMSAVTKVSYAIQKTLYISSGNAMDRECGEDRKISSDQKFVMFEKYTKKEPK